MHRAATLAVLATLAGCAPPPLKMTAHYDQAEVAWSKVPGTASIAGQAFMRTRGGDVRLCAGQPVVLVPRNAYTAEGHGLIQATMGRNLQPTSPEEARTALTFARQTRCDAQGNFAFRELPAGDWFVRPAVTWEVPGGSLGMLGQGGLMSEPVHTDAGKETKVIVTR